MNAEVEEKVRRTGNSVSVANTAVLGGLSILEPHGSVCRSNRPRLRARSEDALETHNEADDQKKKPNDHIACQQANDDGSVLLDEVVKLAAGVRAVDRRARKGRNPGALAATAAGRSTSGAATA